MTLERYLPTVRNFCKSENVGVLEIRSARIEIVRLNRFSTGDGGVRSLDGPRVRGVPDKEAGELCVAEILVLLEICG